MRIARAVLLVLASSVGAHAGASTGSVNHDSTGYRYQYCPVGQGGLRDGLITRANGKRSRLAREGPGVMVGDVDTGKHFHFRRNA